MENQPYFHTAKAMQDIRFIEAAVAKIRGVFPYTACQSMTVAQPQSTHYPRRPNAPPPSALPLDVPPLDVLVGHGYAQHRGCVGGEEGACSCPVPVMSLVLSKSCVRGCHREKIR
jgi:hypothetical protein